MQEVFHAYKTNTELEISKVIGRKLTVMVNLRIVLSCSLDVCFQKKKMCCKTIKLVLVYSGDWRTDDHSKNIELSLKQKISKCSAFNIALGGSTDVSDTAQLVFQLFY